MNLSYHSNYAKLGKGQHNQELYRLENKPKSELLFLIVFMNSKLVRKLCSNISMSSKIKEIKSLDFEKLPIPKISRDKQKSISILYYNPSNTYLKHINGFDINKYNYIDLKVTKKSGILDFNEQIKLIKSIVNNEIKKILL